MVTAGIFMVARESPLFELSDTALNFILVIGSITALFMGFLGIVQNDIKRVVAYSTLSQLGYMTVALGASAYAVAEFHLMTHAFSRRCCSWPPARSSWACTTTRTSAGWGACASTCRSPGSPS
jgi:formate hydrogenlyase subunit 3/multisubunit Na+/H+ antiporter MnhD subunit